MIVGHDPERASALTAQVVAATYEITNPKHRSNA